MFCKLLTNAYHFTYDQVKPCCWIKNTSANILNKAEIKEQVDRLNKVNDWIPECIYCKNLEDAGTTSPRLLANNFDIFSDNDLPGDSVKIEVQIDEDCNAACLACGPWHSTTWQQYIEKTVNAKVSENEKIFPYYIKNTKVEERLDAIKDFVNFNTVKQIHLFGGEPFKTDTQLEILKQVKHPENVNLVYVSNGSMFPSDETIKMWEKFKHINVAFSLDGINDQFNYLRWPLQWSQVEIVLSKFKNINLDKIQLSGSCTATPFNLFYMDKYIEWAEKFFDSVPLDVRIQHAFQNPHPTNEGGPVNLLCVPDELKEVIKEKYGEDSRIFKIIRPFDPVKYEACMKHVEFHDKHRKLNWRETFPEIEHYFPKNS